MLTFKKAQTWQCAKCNATLALQFGIEDTETAVLKLLLDQHQKASINCTAPAGFRLVNTFIKHEDIKEL